VLNARDAMPAGGQIIVATRRCDLPTQSGAWVELVVTDHGCGMDAETRSRIFEPFFTTKATGWGNGLGLHTVRQIVEDSGGVVLVESTPGRGTQVRIRLPRAECPEQLHGSLSSLSPSESSHQPTKRPPFGVVEPQPLRSLTSNRAQSRRIKGKS
jgi:nitrogen-specific signal transduction histidine kinase